LFWYTLLWYSVDKNAPFLLSGSATCCIVPHPPLTPITTFELLPRQENNHRNIKYHQIQFTEHKFSTNCPYSFTLAELIHLQNLTLIHPTFRTSAHLKEYCTKEDKALSQ
jgi:hypothetical protein